MGTWRNLLFVLAAAAAWLAWRGSRLGPVVTAAAFMLVAIGFWTAALGRPYGLLVDPEITLRAAEASVAKHVGGADSFLVGVEAGERTVWQRALGLAPGDAVLLLPTVLPLIVGLAPAAAAAALAGPRERPLAALLWLGGGAGSPDALRGVGVVADLWPRPQAGLAFLCTLAVVAAAGRWLSPRVATVVIAAAVVAAAVCAGSGPPLGAIDAVFLLTVDQWPWALAALPALRKAPPAHLTLVAAGATAVALAPWGPGSDAAWVGHAFYRLGVLLLAARGIAILIDALRPETGRAVAAAVVFATLAGSFLAWWDPTESDPVASASADPIPAALLDAMAWVRSTAPDAVFVVPSDYATTVAALGGRRVLRAPGVLETADEPRRRRTEKALLTGRPVPHLVERYQVRYVLTAPGEFEEYRSADADTDAPPGGLVPVYEGAGIRVYEITR